MRFEPKSKEELASNGLLQPGEYDFEISTAEDAVSKSSGNEMINLTVLPSASGLRVLMNMPPREIFTAQSVMKPSTVR